MQGLRYQIIWTAEVVGGSGRSLSDNQRREFLFIGDNGVGCHWLNPRDLWEITSHQTCSRFGFGLHAPDELQNELVIVDEESGIDF
jgi:hypothetical protein